MERIKEQWTVLRLFLNKKFFVVLGVYFMIVSALSVLAMSLFAHISFFREFEITIQYFIIGFRGDFLTTILKVFTDFSGEISTILLVLLVTGAFFWKRKYSYSLGIILSVSIAELVSIVLKNLVGRGRPPVPLALVSEYSPSFPSGHTIVATAFYGFLLYVIYRNIHHKLLRILLMILCGGIILLAGFTRVYLGAHYPGDVVASYLFGGVWVMLIIYLLKKQENTM